MYGTMRRRAMRMYGIMGKGRTMRVFVIMRRVIGVYGTMRGRAMRVYGTMRGESACMAS